jgi:hypothetical protein
VALLSYLGRLEGLEKLNLSMVASHNVANRRAGRKPKSLGNAQLSWAFRPQNSPTRFREDPELEWDMASKPRVFISHVNGDPSGEQIWPQLRKALTTAGFDVLVDRELLKPGDRWRSEIYSWIGLCNAAVVLISRQAIADPNKYWVARETACLICRRYLDPGLRIIPVLLDGITFAELDATERFRDLELRETQCIFGRNVESILLKIDDGLQNLQSQGDTALSKLAGQIRAELSVTANPAQRRTALVTAIRAANDIYITSVGRRFWQAHNSHWTHRQSADEL